MKKLLLFCLVLTIFSCSKDDNTDQLTTQAKTKKQLTCDNCVHPGINKRHDRITTVPLFDPCDAQNLFVLVDLTDCLDETLWECAVTSAIDAYNATPNAVGVGMTLITNENQLPPGEDVNITIDCGAIDAIAQTTRRETADDISEITLDNAIENEWPCPTDNTANCCQLQKTVMHELGHAIGFGHTQGGTADAEHIPGTPTTEPLSVFSSTFIAGFCREDLCVFTNADLNAMEILYPCGKPDTEIEGPTLICESGSIVTYCVSSDVTVGQWNTPKNMATITTNGNCITVLVSALVGSSTISVTPVIDEGCCEFFPQLTVNSPPNTNFDIQWNGPVCLGDVVTFSLLELPAGQNLQVTNWSATGGLSIMSSNSNIAVAEALFPGQATICATATNACGDSKTYCRNVTIKTDSQCGGPGDIPNPK